MSHLSMRSVEMKKAEAELSWPQSTTRLRRAKVRSHPQGRHYSFAVAEATASTARPRENAKLSTIAFALSARIGVVGSEPCLED
jgi:hypothetical protein